MFDRGGLLLPSAPTPRLCLVKLETARKAIERAERMFYDLCSYVESEDEYAFEDRLPYVLDLLAGVRRQINVYIPRIGPVAEWWKTERTASREAITEMRHAQLKRLESDAQQQVYSRTAAPAGTFKGKPTNSGDTLVWLDWKFTSGYFEGQEVLSVLFFHLTDLETLIEEAEGRLS
jgi:hypothetical protein